MSESRWADLGRSREGGEADSEEAEILLLMFSLLFRQPLIGAHLSCTLSHMKLSISVNFFHHSPHWIPSLELNHNYIIASESSYLIQVLHLGRDREKCSCQISELQVSNTRTLTRQTHFFFFFNPAIFNLFSLN